jgi:predicted aspartyl protease
MDIVTMGRVVVPARIEIAEDVPALEKGAIGPERVRAIEVPDAVVDTAATYLSMPKRLIRQLGLRERRRRIAKTAAGTISFGIYSPVRLTVQGRECFVEVADLPDECPVLIGQIPLEILDFVVDAAGGKLTGNPEHGGEQMFELY